MGSAEQPPNRTSRVIVIHRQATSNTTSWASRNRTLPILKSQESAVIVTFEPIFPLNHTCMGLSLLPLSFYLVVRVAAGTGVRGWPPTEHWLFFFVLL